MANKQIIDLDSVLEVNPTDLLLVRISGQGEDSSINIGNFISSIGNTSINGYYQESYNNITKTMVLKPSNQTDVIGVGEGMKISFLATNDIINQQSYITFDGNQSYPLYQYNKNLDPISVDIEANGYIEAIFNNNRFFQVNIPTTQIYTNDYLAQGIVAGDQSSTIYTLTSAIGVPAQSYYNGMSIIFTSNINSKGNVLVNVDNLGNKVLTDKAGDMIANNLEINQVILAIYNGTNFIKNYFSENVPEVPILPADALDDEGEIIIENVPEDNKVQVTVGNAGNNFTTIKAAIDDLVSNYGDDGGNRLATILLSDTYNWNEQITLLNNNYAWITIYSPNMTACSGAKPLVLNNSSLNLSGIYNYNSAKDTYFISIEKNSNLQIKDATITPTGGGILKAQNSTFNIKDTILNGGSSTPILYLSHCYNSSVKDGQINSPISVSSVGPGYIYITDSNNISFLNITGSIKASWYSRRNNITINNCNFGFPYGVFQSIDDISINMNNTVMTRAYNSSSGQFFFSIENVKQANFTNCNIRSELQGNSVMSNIFARKGTNLVLSGGDYSSFKNSGPPISPNQEIYNIYAINYSTIIRLRNNPIGGTYASDNAVIVTET